MLASLAPAAPAQQWQARTTANAEIQYEDNVRLTQDDGGGQGSFVANARAAARLLRSTENSRVDLAGGLSLNSFVDESDLDNTTAFVRLDSSLRDERNQWGLGLSLDTQSTLTSEEATSGLSQVNRQRFSVRLSPSWRYALSERASLNTSLSYNEVFYDDVDDVALFNFRTGNLSAGGSYQWSERLGLQSVVSYGRFEADDIVSETENIGVQFGGNYRLTELWTLSALLGARRTESTQAGVFGEQVTQDSTGTTFDLSLGRPFARGGGFDLSAVRDLSPSGRGEVVDTTALSVGVRYPWTERLSTTVRFQGNQNRQPDGDRVASDVIFARGEFRLRYLLSRSWTLGAGFSHRWQKRDGDPDAAQSSALSLSIAWNRPWAL